MSDDIILKVENVSKQYRLGLVGTGTLSHDLNRLWHKIRGKEDPYLKIGAVNDRSAQAKSDYVWALQGVDFEVEKGEILGIIGKNGAGKSTLLKILSRVTSPTTGSVKTKGRIASLLEVGTGMHPELTGRENIFLNGAILGMTKSEISDKIDEIIEFSGCQMYIDTPVKRYSSGMRVRLGFAVAAFLEPDILVIDEVLAVGDAEFQKKAIGKMQDISNTSGRTVLFVSHNMAAVKSLCTRAVVLTNGQITFNGNVDEAIKNYIKGNNSSELMNKYIPSEESKLEAKNVKLLSASVTSNSEDDKKSDLLVMDQEILLQCTIQADNLDRKLSCIFQIADDSGKVLFVTSSEKGETVNHKKENSCKLEFKGIIPKNFFNEGEFTANLMIVEDKVNAIIFETDLLLFYVNPVPKKNGGRLGKSKGPLKPMFYWEKRYLND